MAKVYVSRVKDKVGRKRLINVKGGKAKKRIRASSEDALPTEYTEPSGDLNDYAILVHGEKKIGKTSLSLQGGKVFVLQFDVPQKGYKIMERVIRDWKHFLKLLDKLEAAAEDGNFPYDRIVVDGAAEWYRMAFIHACDRLAVDDPGDIEFGKGWNLVRRTFADAVNRVLRLPCGRWFIAHSAWKEVNARDGNKIVKLLPNLPSQAEDVLNGKVDAWCAYDYSDDKRILVVMGDERTGAGHRMDGKLDGFPHFRTVKGKAIREIDMGSDPKEAFDNFLKAFNNEQLISKVGDGVTVPVIKPRGKKK